MTYKRTPQELLRDVLLLTSPGLSQALRLGGKSAPPRQAQPSTNWSAGPDPEANLGYISRGHDRAGLQGGYALPRSATNGPGNSVRVERSDGTTTLRTGGTRTWRNNNPGNIGAGQTARELGAIGSAGRFAVFPDVSVGANAITGLLKRPGYQNGTLGGAIATYAPASENDTEGYTRIVEKYVGLALDPNEGS